MDKRRILDRFIMRENEILDTGKNVETMDFKYESINEMQMKDMPDNEIKLSIKCSSNQIISLSDIR